MGFVCMNGIFDLFGLVLLFAPYAYYVQKSNVKDGTKIIQGDNGGGRLLKTGAGTMEGDI